MQKQLYTLFTLMSLLFVFSCSDDDTFSVYSSDRLTMECDTVSFDTVFTRIPTAAKYFWVRNNSEAGLRCTNVRLEKGNQSGFRVNVDGVFLGTESGYKVNNVELRKGDSIRVFVELTAPINNLEGPQLREDNLIFQLESGVKQVVNLSAMTWDADTVHTLRITENTTLDTSLRPLIVFKSIVVEPGVTLNIAKGSTIYFHDNAGIDVKGTLRCEGEADNEVTLRGYRLDNMFDYLPYDFLPGHWQGIHFATDSYNNVLTYTDIHGSYDGIVCDSADVKRQKLILNACTIHNCQGVGLSTQDCRIDVYNSQITNTLGHCVALYGGDAVFNHCTVGQFYPFDSNRGEALHFTNIREGVNTPLVMVAFLNSIITGYAEDVIMGNASDSVDVDFNYFFSHCILRTPAVEDTLRFEKILWETKDSVVCGEKHFVKMDTENFRYDFHLDSISPGIGYADRERILPTDRKGLPRNDGYCNVGCY